MDNKTLTTLSAYADANRLLRAQRDELAAALREIARIPADFDVCPDIALRMYEVARAALAKVQGQ